MKNQNTLSLSTRLSSPCPPFFQKLRNAGLVLAAISGAILTAPISLPAAVITVAGYLATAGVVASAVSAATVKRESD
ncbi:hypothetical protein [Desertivirga brevis]|uniref:hypothetical protein n=1 Tax=Desertivirga brevis TaxID=2810310 RepID=UPI001A97CC9E|nr:hypothetical protein [Pedobacter sp. SYSU D00873]